MRARHEHVASSRAGKRGSELSISVAKARAPVRLACRVFRLSGGVSVWLAATRAEIAKLQRILGKKTLENEVLKETVESTGALACNEELIANLPSYGYRRACVLINRSRDSVSLPLPNPKQVYRLMAGNGLLMPKAPRRRQSRRLHEGKVEVASSDQR